MNNLSGTWLPTASLQWYRLHGTIHVGSKVPSVWWWVGRKHDHHHPFFTCKFTFEVSSLFYRQGSQIIDRSHARAPIISKGIFAFGSGLHSDSDFEIILVFIRYQRDYQTPVTNRVGYTGVYLPFPAGLVGLVGNCAFLVDSLHLDFVAKIPTTEKSLIVLHLQNWEDLSVRWPHVPIFNFKKYLHFLF